MAAPTKTARIGLSFDKPGLENSWFLVDFSKHDKIEDVAHDIKNQYFNCITDRSKAVILRINNFLLPPNGSSELFRENDIVSVRLETEPEDRETLSGKWMHSLRDDSSRQISFSHSLTEDVEEKDHYTRKRKHYETDSREKHKSSKHKKRKHRDKQASEEVLEDILSDTSQYIQTTKKSKGHDKSSKNEDKVECTTETAYSENVSSTGVEINDLPANVNGEQKIPKSKAKSSKESEQVPTTDRNNSADIGSEYKQEVADTDVTGNAVDMKTEKSMVNVELSSQSDVSSIGSTEKKKRTRRRKRRHKTLSSTYNGDATDTTVDSGKLSLNESNQLYKGREVDRSEGGLYGSLPDKLEPPKYYRHGYRNLNTYSVEPSKHVKFGSDSDPEEAEESTQQYSFLCKSRKTPDIDRQTEIPDTENCAQGEIKESETALREETKIGGSMCAEDDSRLLRNGICENLEHKEQSSQNESFTAVPFNYSDSFKERSIVNTTNNNVAIETSPVTLERKTLSNGVSVFVRQRGSPGSQFKGMSKQEQLDTKVTNVSAIFVNTQEPEFKVPTSPAPRQKLSPKPRIPVEKDSLTRTHTFQGVELSSYTPLVGTPKAGDTIAYKLDFSKKKVEVLLPLDRGHVHLRWLSFSCESFSLKLSKVLEISADCTPEVSDYRVSMYFYIIKRKEGKQLPSVIITPDLSRFNYNIGDFDRLNHFIIGK